MQSFFAVARRDEERWDERLLDATASELARWLTYAEHVTAQRAIASRCGRVALFAFTNEPRLTIVEERGLVLAVSGYSTAAAQLLDARPDHTLFRQLTELPGRFAAALFDPDAGRIAAASSVVAVDPLYHGRTDQMAVVGTQASAIAGLLHGELRVDPGGLFSFINTGFFGSRDTAFEDVTCLPPASTWTVEDGVENRTHRSLADLKRAARGAAPRHRLADDFTAAVREMAGAAPISLGLTGGRDSRILLAGALRAGLEVDCYTDDSGEWCASDVYVARLLAARLGVPHRVVKSAAPGSGAPSDGPIDPLRLAASTLRATDAGMYLYDSHDLETRFHPVAALRGYAGGLLRGGYAVKHKDLTRARAHEIARAQFGRQHRYFRDDVRDRYFDFLDDWMADFDDDLGPHDLLECLYADFRCGRWVAAQTRALGLAARDFTPFLDNRLALTTISLPAEEKTRGAVGRELLRALWPGALEVPLANNLFPGTTAAAAQALKREHPEAFRPWRSLALATDWRRAFPDFFVDHIRAYCLDQGRLDLLRDAMQVDEVARFLREGATAFREGSNMKFVHGLYSACVLASGDWLATAR